MSDVSFKDFDILSEQDKAEAVALLQRYDQLEKQDGCPKDRIFADNLLLEEMHEYEGYINDMVTVDLKQNEFDALVSWVFNLGPSNLSSSTLLSRLNNKVWDDVPNQIKRWNKAGGQVKQGLVRRREAEALLFEGKEWHEV